MFRAKIARAAPTSVIVVKKVKDGLTEEERDSYMATFKKFDTDGGGAMDSAELGKLIRILGYGNEWSFLVQPFSHNPSVV